MILSGPRIAWSVNRGDCEIDPFDPDLINPSSYDLTLGDVGCVYVLPMYANQKANKVYSAGAALPSAPRWLDSARENPSYRFLLDPKQGFRVDPGRIYLLHTREVVAPGLDCVAVVDGKSSLGRLGLVVHATAGYVDPGFRGQVTLEMAAIGEPVVVYPGMRIAQIRFQRLEVDLTLRLNYELSGHYVGDAARGPVPSRSYLQFREREAKTDLLPPPPDCDP